MRGMPMTDPRRVTSADAEACVSIVLGWLGAQDWMLGAPDRNELAGLLRDGEVRVTGYQIAGGLVPDTKLELVDGLFCARSGERRGAGVPDLRMEWA